MAMRKPEEKVTVQQVLKLVEQLTFEEQAELRRVFFEDQEDIRIALERLANPGKTWSLEELEQGVDLEG